jgi:hypothetical protein
MVFWGPDKAIYDGANPKPGPFCGNQPRFTLGATPPEFSDQVIAFPANHRSQAGEHSLCGNQTLLKGSPDAALATL